MQSPSANSRPRTFQRHEGIPARNIATARARCRCFSNIATLSRRLGKFPASGYCAAVNARLRDEPCYLDVKYPNAATLELLADYKQLIWGCRAIEQLTTGAGRSNGASPQ